MLRSRPTLQLSCSLGGLHSSKGGANAHPCQHAAPVSGAVTACGPGHVGPFWGVAPATPRSLCSSNLRALDSPPLHAPLRLAHRRLSCPFGRSSQQGRIRYRTKPTLSSRPVVYTRRPPTHVLPVTAPFAALMQPVRAPQPRRATQRPDAEKRPVRSAGMYRPLCRRRRCPP